MKDTVIKGSGNSRSMKTVPNAPIIYPDFATFIQEFASTGIPFDLGPLNEAGLTTHGTDLNKASLLTDALCSALGLATTATPTQAMEKLRQLVATAQSTANAKGYVSVGSYTGTGVCGPNNPNSLTFPFAPKTLELFGRIYGGYWHPFQRYASYYTILATSALTTEYKAGWGFSNGNNEYTTKSFAKKDISGKTISWYWNETLSSYAHAQFNDTRNEYFYIALG